MSNDNSLTVTELQRLIDTAIIRKEDTFYVQGRDKSYPLYVRYAEYLVEYLKGQGIQEFHIMNDQIYRH